MGLLITTSVSIPYRRRTRNQATRTRHRQHKSPPLSTTTPSIAFTSNTLPNESSQTQAQDPLDKDSTSEPGGGVASPTKQRRVTPRSSSPTKDEEDTCLQPSSPKTPKQDTFVPTKSTNQPSSSSSTCTHAPTSTSTTQPSVLPPTRSRKNLADRMKLASNDPHSLTPSSHLNTASMPSNTGRTSTRQASKLSAKQLAQKTVAESMASSSSKESVDKSQSTKSASLDHPVESESVRHLRGMSARELAQLTDPERRMSARVAVRYQRKGKSPAPPPSTTTSHTPQLHQFKSFIVESPTKSPRFVPLHHHYITHKMLLFI